MLVCQQKLDYSCSVLYPCRRSVCVGPPLSHWHSYNLCTTYQHQLLCELYHSIGGHTELYQEWYTEFEHWLGILGWLVVLVFNWFASLISSAISYIHLHTHTHIHTHTHTHTHIHTHTHTLTPPHTLTPLPTHMHKHTTCTHYTHTNTTHVYTHMHTHTHTHAHTPTHTHTPTPHTHIHAYTWTLIHLCTWTHACTHT